MTSAAPSSSPAGGSGIRVEREGRAIVVKRHDAVLASTERALLVHGILESPVYYVPRDDVYMEHLTPGGDRPDPDGARDGRSFFSVTASGGGVADAAWMHDEAAGDLAPLRDHVGFDPAIFNVTAG